LQAADITVSTDCLDIEEDNQEGGCKSGQYNTGLLYFRPTSTTDEILKECDAMLMQSFLENFAID
jgi:hypothetical protein